VEPGPISPDPDPVSPGDPSAPNPGSPADPGTNPLGPPGTEAPGTDPGFEPPSGMYLFSSYL
jgi:hypothetical protein